jgi:colanic acid/amylovoran biosynthesis protein
MVVFMKKKILVSAYIKGNLGDDLFLKVLCERYPNVDFYVFGASKYKSIFNEITNLHYLSNDLFISKGLNKIARSFGCYDLIRTIIGKFMDGHVLIGGSLFMESSNSKDIAFLKNKNSILSKKPNFLIGSNFGPFNTNEFLLKHKILFEKFSDVCFRDNYSYGLFEKLNNTRISDDVVFQLKYNPRNTSEKKLTISMINLEVRPELKQYKNEYLRKITDLILLFVKQDYEINLISFCDDEGDLLAIKEVCNLIPLDYHKSLNIISHSNINSSLEVMANSKYIIATRFHAMIVGWVLDIPVHPMVYSDKMINVINDVEFCEPYSDIRNISDVQPLDIYNSLINQKLHNFNSQKINSENQFLMLDKFLK